MKILLIYSSRTGNTRKVAEAIYEVLPSGSIICPVEDNPSYKDYDMIIIGFWVDKGLPDIKTLEYMESIGGKKIGIFGTSGAYNDSERGKKTLERTRQLLEPRNEVIAEFICQGKIDERLLERYKNRGPDHPNPMTEEKRKRHEEAKKHPDSNDLNRAQEVFRKII
jgi:flavodoxin